MAQKMQWDEMIRFVEMEDWLVYIFQEIPNLKTQNIDIFSQELQKENIKQVTLIKPQGQIKKMFDISRFNDLFDIV